MTVQVLTVEQVAQLLGCSKKTVQARALQLGGLKFGVDWIFPAEALNRRLVEMALQQKPTPASTPAPAAVLVHAQPQPTRAHRRARPAPTLLALQRLAGAID